MRWRERDAKFLLKEKVISHLFKLKLELQTLCDDFKWRKTKRRDSHVEFSVPCSYMRIERYNNTKQYHTFMYEVSLIWINEMVQNGLVWRE